MSNLGMGCDRPEDPEFWLGGGTGVSNFTEDKRHLYVEAVKRFGDPDLWVAEKSFGRGNQNYGGSIHCKKVKDLSAFWRIFEEVKRGGDIASVKIP